MTIKHPSMNVFIQTFKFVAYKDHTRLGLLCLYLFRGGRGGRNRVQGGAPERGSLVLEEHYSPALQSLRISAFSTAALNIVIKNKYTHIISQKIRVTLFQMQCVQLEILRY